MVQFLWLLGGFQVIVILLEHILDLALVTLLVQHRPVVRFVSLVLALGQRGARKILIRQELHDLLILRSRSELNCFRWAKNKLSNRQIHDYAFLFLLQLMQYLVLELA